MDPVWGGGVTSLSLRKSHEMYRRAEPFYRMELLCAPEHVPRGPCYFQVILHMEMIVILGIIIINQCKSVRCHAHLTSQSTRT